MVNSNFVLGSDFHKRLIIQISLNSEYNNFMGTSY
jgi:hypothetical protein